MAIMLSSSESSILEPKRKNRWVMQLTETPGSAEGAERLAFIAKSCGRPKISFNAIETHRLNERFYTLGKPTYEAIDMVFYDFIQGEKSASSILYKWAESVYNPLTGQMFFKSEYSTSAILALLDPSGAVIEQWHLFYVQPTSVSWGELAAEDDGLIEVSANFRFDWAIKAVEFDTSPNSI